jgi:hypothetical protein
MDYSLQMVRMECEHEHSLGVRILGLSNVEDIIFTHSNMDN